MKTHAHECCPTGGADVRRSPAWKFAVNALAVSALAVAGRADAQHTMTADDADGTTSFNTGGNWDDKQSPKAGDTYTANKALRTPGNASSHTFAGDRLTVTATLAYKGTAGGSITVNDLVLQGGAIGQWVPNVVATVKGNITIPSGFNGTFSNNGDNRRETLAQSVFHGAGTLYMTIPSNSPQHSVTLTADNTDFTGRIVLRGHGKLIIGSEENLGGNPPTFTQNQLEFNGAMLVSQAALTLDDPNRGITVNNTTQSGDIWPGAWFHADGGNAITLAIPAAGEGPVTKTGSGVLTLAADWPLFTGATAVSNGLLRVNSAFNGTASVAVHTGAALGGTGTVHAPVTFASGANLLLADDGAYATLSLADATPVTFENARLSFDVRDPAAGPSDVLALAGPLVIEGENTLALGIPSGEIPAGEYKLAVFASRSGTGAFSFDQPYSNAALVWSDTNLVLSVTGGGMTSTLVWTGAEDGAWDHQTLNWMPADAPFADNLDVLFDDSGSADLPVTVASVPVAPRTVSVNATQAYILDGGVAGILASSSLAKTGTGALTLKGTHHYDGITVGAYGGTTDGCTFTLAADSAVAFSGGLTVRPQNTVFEQEAGSVISGNGGLTVGCNANLRGVNTYTGTSTIGYQNSPRNIKMFNADALGTGNVTLRGGNASTHTKLVIGLGVTVSNKTLTVSGDGNIRSGLWYADASGTGCWNGDIAVAADGWLMFGNDNSGGTLVVGSPSTNRVITNVGPQSLGFRGGGPITLWSVLNMPTRDLYRDDGGTVTVCSTNNAFNNVAHSQGTIRLGADNALCVTAGYTMGKNANNAGNKCSFNLNGHTQTLRQLNDSHYVPFDGTVDEGHQYVLSTGGAATLIVNGTGASVWTNKGSIISGPVTLVKAGTGAFTLGYTNAFTGLVVSNGTFTVTADGRTGPACTNVLVAGGTLALLNNDALCADAAVTFAADGTGKINLPAGVNVTVDTLWIGDKQKYGGTYGATASGARVEDDGRFSGGGILTVRHGNGGTVIILK